MTNSIAIVLALFIIGGIVADIVLNDSEALVFLGRKGLGLIDQIAFWR